MAVTATSSKMIAPAKLTAAQARSKLNDAYKEIDKLKAENEDLKTNYATCCVCGKLKAKYKFYKSTDPINKLCLTPVCKECARELAVRVDEDGNEYCTKENIKLALRYLNKPYIETLWDSSIQESENEFSGKRRSTPYDSYIKNVSLPNYNTLCYYDGDDFQIMKHNAYEHVQVENNKLALEKNNEIIEQYKMNRRDILHSIGYDPFENYPIEEDKPILYAQLNSFIDDETKNDGMKMGAVIQIVKKLNQAEKLNDQIDKYISDTTHAADNMALIDKMAGSSQKLMNVASSLAKDNGISVNFNNNKSKGANTLSGRIKKLTEIGLREAKINTFDIGTCEGMRQVAEISEEARHKQIGYDENIAQEIKDIKVELVEKLSKERDKAVEDARKLLMENKDLKDFLKMKGLVDEHYKVIDDD